MEEKTLYQLNPNLKEGDLILIVNSYSSKTESTLGIFKEYMEHSEVFGDGVMFKTAITLPSVRTKLLNISRNVGIFAGRVIELYVGKEDVTKGLKSNSAKRIYASLLGKLFPD